MKDSTKEKWIEIVLTTVLVAAIAGLMFYGGYKYGHTYGYIKGEKVGYDKGYEQAWESILKQTQEQFEFEHKLDEKEGAHK